MAVLFVDEKAPAKINLALDVRSKRADGYHEVEMIMTMVDLSDRLRFTHRENGQISIQCTTHSIPHDERNLAYQAAKLMQQTYQVNSGVDILIEKIIPVSAGLAGGSSDAAATLRGLNRLWGLNRPIEELMELGAKIGSDVPFCVQGGTALATGRGEKIHALPTPPGCWVIIAKPPIGVSTADVYGRFRLDQVTSRPDIPAMIQAITEKKFDDIATRLGNVLEQVTLNLYPEVAALKDRISKMGADGVLMSGSGPTVFALVNKQAKAERIYNGLRGFCKDVFMVRLLTTP